MVAPCEAPRAIHTMGSASDARDAQPGLFPRSGPSIGLRPCIRWVNYLETVEGGPKDV